MFLTTAGFVNFALFGFHLKNLGIFSDIYIPLLYAGAMAIDALFGLAAGKIYDQLKTKSKNNHYEYFILLFIPLVGVFIPFFIFSNKIFLIIFGTMLLGISLGIQETIMKAAVADIVPIQKRSSGYGIFNVLFGLAFFTGNTVAGYLYDYSIPILITVLAIIEFAAIPVFYLMRKK